MTRTCCALVALGTALLVSPSATEVGAQGSPQPAATGTLDVMVVDEAGQPIPGVRVALPGKRAVTARNGSCNFSLLPARYSILVHKTGYRGRRLHAGVRPGETTTLRLVLQKLPTARPPK